MKTHTTTAAKKAAINRAKAALLKAAEAKEAAAEAYREAEREAREAKKPNGSAAATEAREAYAEAYREAAAALLIEAEEAAKEAAAKLREAEATPTKAEAEEAAKKEAAKKAEAERKAEEAAAQREAYGRAIELQEAARREAEAERKAAEAEEAERRKSAPRFISEEERAERKAAEERREAERKAAAREAKKPDYIGMTARISAFNAAPEAPEALEGLARATVAAVLRKLRRVTPENNMINNLWRGLWQAPREGAPLSEAAALVNEAAAALLLNVAEHTPNGEAVNVERPYTVKRLKLRVAIREEAAPEVTEEVQTTAIQEAFRAVRRAIEAARSVKAPEAALRYNYQRSANGGYIRIAKYREGISREELNREEDIIAALNLTAREAVILDYRREGYGNNAIATRLNVKRGTVQKALERIGARAVKLFDIKPLLKEAKSGEERRKIEPEERAAIFAAIASGEAYRATAARFGVSVALVQKVVKAEREGAKRREEAARGAALEP